MCDQPFEEYIYIYIRDSQFLRMEQKWSTNLEIPMPQSLQQVSNNNEDTESLFSELLTSLTETEFSPDVPSLKEFSLLSSQNDDTIEDDTIEDDTIENDTIENDTIEDDTIECLIPPTRNFALSDLHTDIEKHVTETKEALEKLSKEKATVISFNKQLFKVIQIPDKKEYDNIRNALFHMGNYRSGVLESKIDNCVKVMRAFIIVNDRAREVTFQPKKGSCGSHDVQIDKMVQVKKDDGSTQDMRCSKIYLDINTLKYGISAGYTHSVEQKIKHIIHKRWDAVGPKLSTVHEVSLQQQQASFQNKSTKPVQMTYVGSDKKQKKRKRSGKKQKKRKRSAEKQKKRKRSAETISDTPRIYDNLFNNIC